MKLSVDNKEVRMGKTRIRCIPLTDRVRAFALAGVTALWRGSVNRLGGYKRALLSYRGTFISWLLLSWSIGDRVARAGASTLEGMVKTHPVACLCKRSSQ